MISSRARSVIFLIISLSLIFAFVYYLYVNADKYQNLLRMSPLSVIFLVALSLVFMFVNGIVNVNLFQSLGAKVYMKDGFLLTAASSLANQLPILGGIISKAYYLKRRHNLSYSKFASAMLALFFCFVAVNGLIGSAVLLYWMVFKNMDVPVFLFVGFLAMVSFILVFWLPIDRIRLSEKILKSLSQALEGWSIIGKNPVLMLKLIGLQITLMLLLATRYWLTFHMLSQNITLSQAILFSSASILTQLVSIAPGGLGVREMIVGGVASALGFDMGVSVVAVGLDSLVATLIVVLVGGISTIILGKQISNPYS